jgi:CheY-like chemotaxis protein
MIFLIEDEPDIRESLREVLELEGYEVQCAANGFEAKESLRRLPTPALILLDMLMPVMNGREFRSWQLEVPRLARVPVIVLSADPSQKELEGILHLHKPVDLSELLSAVKDSTLKELPA